MSKTKTSASALVESVGPFCGAECKDRGCATVHDIETKETLPPFSKEHTRTSYLPRRSKQTHMRYFSTDVGCFLFSRRRDVSLQAPWLIVIG